MHPLDPYYPRSLKLDMPPDIDYPPLSREPKAGHAPNMHSPCNAPHQPIIWPAGSHGGSDLPSNSVYPRGAILCGITGCQPCLALAHLWGQRWSLVHRAGSSQWLRFSGAAQDYCGLKGSCWGCAPGRNLGAKGNQAGLSHGSSRAGTFCTKGT